MWAWIKNNSGAIEAVAAGMMVLVAIITMLGVKYQIDANAVQQRSQSARDYYRGVLEISMNKPELASFDYCIEDDPNQLIAYKSYVEYLLYTAEQTLSLGPEWSEPISQLIEPHAAYICENIGDSYLIPEVAALVVRACIRSEPCE